VFPWKLHHKHTGRRLRLAEDVRRYKGRRRTRGVKKRSREED